jgi:hypothetical protein
VLCVQVNFQVGIEGMACFPNKFLNFTRNLQSFYKSKTILLIFKLVSPTCVWNTKFQNGEGLVYVISATFSFSCWRVIDNPIVYMFEIQVIIVASFYFVSAPWGPTFLLLVLLLKWFENEVNGMFQYLVTFCKKMCPFSTTSMASSRCWYVHLANLVALNTLLVLANLCISTMGRWYCYCVCAWTNCDYGISYIVGVIWMIGCGHRFSCFAQLVLEMPFHHFHDTFKCVEV